MLCFILLSVGLAAIIIIAVAVGFFLFALISGAPFPNPVDSLPYRRGRTRDD